MSSVRQRVNAVLSGKRPDHLPFIDRIDFWYRHHLLAGTMPQEFKGLPLLEVSKKVGIGRQNWKTPYTYRYRGIEVISRFNGEVTCHQTDPQMDDFPALWAFAPLDRPGVTVTELITPLGKWSVQHEMLDEMIKAGVSRPIIKTKPPKDENDYRVLEYILERGEYLPRYEDFYREDAALGEDGYLIPGLDRTPFQTLLIDVFGETNLFYALNDNRKRVERLLDAWDRVFSERLKQIAGLSARLVEFPDNLEGYMTNPRLFKQYSIPAYQRYTDILHQQGKKVASHTDGNLKALVNLMPETGLDICESFTPTPTTHLSFDEAFKTWKNGPMIWGGIPSYYLEKRVNEEEFRAYIDRVLKTVGDGLIILGVGDAVMSDNLIERVRYIAQQVEQRT